MLRKMLFVFGLALCLGMQAAVDRGGNGVRSGTSPSVVSHASPRESPLMLDFSFGLCTKTKATFLSGTNWFGFVAKSDLKYAVRLHKDVKDNAAFRFSVITEDGSPLEALDASLGLGVQGVARDDGLLRFAIVADPTGNLPRISGSLQAVAMEPDTSTCFPEVSMFYAESGRTECLPCDMKGYNIFSNGVTVTGMAPVGKILYAVDDRELAYPRDQLPKSGLWVDGKQTVRMQAIVSGYVRSEEVSASFARGVCGRPEVRQEPVSGSYGPQRVYLTSPMEDAEIRYTTDGSPVTEASPLYTGPFVVREVLTVKARAYKADWVESEELSAWIDDGRIEIGDMGIERGGFFVEDGMLKVAIELVDGDGAVIPPGHYAVSYTNVWEGETLENALVVRIEGRYGYRGVWEEIVELPSRNYAVVGGQVWFYRPENGGATIVSGPVADGVLTVPAEVNGLPVYAIADYAFVDCPFEDLREVRLPGTVFRIGEGAFEGTPFWENLSEGTPDGALMAVGPVVVGTKGTLLGDVVVPDGICGIRDSAFSGQGEITSVALPEGLKEVGNWAFQGCSALTRVTLPASLVSVGRDAFGDTPYLQGRFLSVQEGALVRVGHVLLGARGTLRGTVRVPETVTVIAGGAFAGQCELCELHLPTALKSIGRDVFENCGSLLSLDLPGSVEIVGTSAFASGAIQSIYVAEEDDEARVREMLEYAACDVPFIGKRSALRLSYEEGPFDWTDVAGVVSSRWLDMDEGIGNELFTLVCSGRGTLRFRWAIRAEDVPADLVGPCADRALVGVDEEFTADWRVTCNAGYIGGGTENGAWNEQSMEVAFYEDLPHRIGLYLTDEERLLSGNVKIEIRDVRWVPAEDGFGVVATFDPNGGTLRASESRKSFGRWYWSLPVPVRVGAEFVGWTDQPLETVGDPLEAPLVQEGDETPLTNVVLRALWERFDPSAYEGECERTERGFRCRVEGREPSGSSSTASCSYEVPGRGYLTYRWRVVDATDEAHVLQADDDVYFGGASSDEVERLSRGFWTSGRTASDTGWKTARVAVASGDPSECFWLIANGGSVPAILEVADIQWEWAPEDFDVDVRLEPCGGRLVSDATVVRGDRYGELPQPVREGAIFMGWTEERWHDCNSCRFVDESTWTPLASKAVLYAVWDVPIEEVLDPLHTIRDDDGYGLEMGDMGDYGVKNTWSCTDDDVSPATSREVLRWAGVVSAEAEVDVVRIFVHGCGTLRLQGFRWNNYSGGGCTPCNSCCGDGYGERGRLQVGVSIDGRFQSLPQIVVSSETGYAIDVCSRSGLMAQEGGLSPDDSDYDLHEIRIVVRGGSGYKDSGWNISGELGAMAWTPAPAELSVSFNGCGGTVSGEAVRTYAVGDCYGELPEVSRPKYTFLGWFASPDDVAPVRSDDLVRISEPNLCARWKTDARTALGNGVLRFASKGDYRWMGTSEYAHDAAYSSAGTEEVMWGETNVMTSVVQGSGLLAFWWLAGEDVSDGWDEEECASLTVWLDGRLVVSCDRTSEWRHMTLPVMGAGNHIVEWKYTPGADWRFLSPLECWQTGYVRRDDHAGVRPGAWVDEVGWTPAGEVRDLVSWARGVSEGGAWLTGVLPHIEAGYSVKIADEPANYRWRILRAFAKLAQLGENKNLLAVLARFGFSPNYQVLGQFFGTLDYVDAPLSNDVVDLVAGEAVPALTSALMDLEAIPDDWTGSLALDPTEYPVDVVTFIDVADVMFGRSLLKGALASLAVAESYDLSLDYMNVEMEAILADAGLPTTLEDVVMDHPAFLKRVRNAERLAEGREILREALQTYQIFDDLMLARNSAEVHFFEYTEKDAAVQRSVREKVAKLLEALDGPVMVDGSDLSDIRGYCLTNVAQEVSLAPFFAGEVTRRYLPTQIDGNRPVFDTFPTMAFGGVFPGLTKDTVASWLSDNGVHVDYTPHSEYEPPVLFRTFNAAIPDLGSSATKAEISDALSGTVDPAVREHVNDAQSYAAYATWASGLRAAGVPLKEIKASPYAWLSSALATPRLMSRGIEAEDLLIESLLPKSEEADVELTVSVKDVEIGSTASTENLKAIFSLEGASVLDVSAFSPDNVDTTFEQPVNGKVKVRAKPKDASTKTFFMKVRMRQ